MPKSCWVSTSAENVIWNQPQERFIGPHSCCVRSTYRGVANCGADRGAGAELARQSASGVERTLRRHPFCCAQVDDLHATYIAAVQDLFQRYKAQAGYSPEESLLIV